MFSSSRSTALLLVLLPCAVYAQGLPAFKTVTTDDGIWVQEGDTKVLFYQRRMKSKDGKLARANYVHPLLDLDGEPLTEDFPADHLHHRGIFWAWHQVTIGDKAVGDPWALKDCGWDISEVKAESSDNGMSLNTEVYWLSPLWLDAKRKQMPFVRERAIIKVHRAEKERRIVDFEIALTALQPETRIGGAAPKPGYGGFSTRFRLPKDVRFISPTGEVQPLAGPVDAAKWIDVAGAFANDRNSGIAILTHPTTPGFPQPWILRNRSSMQNAVYPGATPVTLPTEQSMVLRYRLVIHRKAVQVEQIDRWHQDYAKVAKR